jgi:hypothetical protein
MLKKRVRHETRSPRSVKLAEAKSCIRRSQRRKALKKRNEDPLVQAAAGLSEFIALLKAKKNGV